MIAGYGNSPLETPQGDVFNLDFKKLYQSVMNFYMSSWYIMFEILTYTKIYN